MTIPPEVYGCLSLASSYERRRGDFWKKGNGFKRKAFKTKCEKKIARLVSRAVRLLAGRGMTVDDILEENNVGREVVSAV